MNLLFPSRFWALPQMASHVPCLWVQGALQRMGAMLQAGLLAGLLCLAAPSRAEVPLVAEQGRYELGTQMQVLVDPEGSLTLNDVASAAASKQFTPLTQPRPNFGFSRSAYWLKFELRNVNAPSSEWLLESRYPLLDQMDTYLVYADGRRLTHQGGDLQPFSARAIKHRSLNVRVPLAPGERVQVLVRVQSESSLQLGMTLWRPDAFAARDHESQWVMGIYYGILLSMLFYNLLIYASIRDIAYLYYVVYIAGWALLQASLGGLAFEYLWPNSPWWGNRANLFFVFICITGISLFTRAFLDLKQYLPRLNTLMLWMAAASGVMSLGALWMNYGVLTKLANGITLLHIAIVTLAGVLAWRRGAQQARFFLLAWSMLLIGAAAFSLKQFGVLPSHFVFDYGLQIGSAIEVIGLSLALAHRMRMLKDENMRIQREATDLLEIRVAQRTQELDTALHALKETSEALQKMSRTDALTGIYNRAYFNERMEQEWRRAMRLGHPIGLLILDVDFFKAVNDTHGHPGGDACLVAVAQLLQKHLHRAADACFRYGGEEFVILLPSTGLDGTTHLARQVLASLRQMQIEFQGKTFSITASVGAAATEPKYSHAGPDGLVGVADAALYAAKRQGRDQVVSATTQVTNTTVG